MRAKRTIPATTIRRIPAIIAASSSFRLDVEEDDDELPPPPPPNEAPAPPQRRVNIRATIFEFVLPFISYMGPETQINEDYTYNTSMFLQKRFMSKNLNILHIFTNYTIINIKLQYFLQNNSVKFKL